jgi:predicted P-loop ATPase
MSAAVQQATVSHLPDLPKLSADWRSKLARGSGGFLGDERNILIALRSAPELAELLWFDEFALQVMFASSPPWRVAQHGSRWTESDDTQLMAWLQERDLMVRTSGAIADCITVVAQEKAVHPARDYVEGLLWDQEPRLGAWLAEYLGADANPQYLAVVGRKFLVSAVARIMQPGAQADHVLVLEGPQGIGKTSAARALAVNPEWFAGNLPDIHTKDAALQLCGRWIVEIAELKAIRTSQLEATKSFLTQRIDTFRPPYARRAGQFPRQCVFIGTTNESEYLRDRTGNRRYWPVSCRNIDLDGLVHDRDQLWAEALHEFRQGATWHLTPEEESLAREQQSERVHVTELEQDVAKYLAEVSGNNVTVRDVLVYGLGLKTDEHGYADNARKLGPAVAEAIVQCGWEKQGRRGKARRTTYQRRQG